MRLFHIPTGELVDLFDWNLPSYAILSHTWGREDAIASILSVAGHRCHKRLPVYKKVVRACEDATRRGISHLWVDYLCIDISSSADLDAAVNGSFQRLIKSSVCLVYLDDLPAHSSPLDESTWAQCRYWKRAWMVQELILPPRVEFFDEKWNHRGSRDSPEYPALLSSITGIPRTILENSEALYSTSLALRISWFADREASREEDTAYSMVAITGVTMQVRYGEGAVKAFLRLQEEMLHDTRDGSIFAWRSTSKYDIRGLLARSPSEFRHFSRERWQTPWKFDGKVRFSSKGVEFESRISRHGSRVLIEIGQRRHDDGSADVVCICLKQQNDIYVREIPDVLYVSQNGCYATIDIARDVSPRDSTIAFQSGTTELQSSGAVMADTETKKHQSESGLTVNPEAYILQSEAQSRENTTGDEVRLQQNIRAKEDEVGAPIPLCFGVWQGSMTAKKSGVKRHNSGRPIMPFGGQQRPQKLVPCNSSDALRDASAFSQNELVYKTARSGCEDANSEGGDGGENVIENNGIEDDDVREEDTEAEDTEAEDTEEEDTEADDIENDSSEAKGTEEENTEDDNAENESDDLLSDYGTVHENTQDEVKGLQIMRPKLLKISYGKLQAWKASVRYVAPPEYRIPTRKRPKVTASQNQRRHAEEEEEEEEEKEGGQHDQNESDFVIVFRNNRYFHFACPFYMHDAKRYRRCLVQHTFTSIEGIIRHIGKQHVQPAYCPMCRDTFCSIAQRNEHILARTCNMRNPAPIEGVSEYQHAKMRKRDDARLSESKRWWYIWDQLFPTAAESPRSPYLEEGIGRAVSMVRDYWASHGRECVVDFLDSCNLLHYPPLDKDRLTVALRRLTLEDLLGQVLDERRID